ncbi:hypothetical protein [Actinophytocola xanthii]|uniref:Neocarzinostatin n=1 Tax=Actinophytocola xanthii TaxID=1912961 RepID=A0A1Q8CPE5_9PSEU|nr:hypothetical protein [Actinophytocola xanthii]OLF16239.1 hypothetical protein BU204_17885 [Actinophytocola xanthii]
MRRGLVRFGVVLAAVVAAVVGSGGAAAADPVLQVSATAARLASGGAQLVLTGQYVCGPFSPDSDGVVDLTVTQEAGSTDITGYGYIYLTVCDGAAHAYSATVDSVAGQFARGRVQVLGGGYACDRGPGGACAFGEFGPVTLRAR